jgi:hypothetical protein
VILGGPRAWLAMECRDTAVLMVGTRARSEGEISVNLAQVRTLDEEIDEMISRYDNRAPDRTDL